MNAFLQNHKLTESSKFEVSDLEYEHINAALNVPSASDIGIGVQRGFKVKFIELTKITKQYEKSHGGWVERRGDAQKKSRAIDEEMLIKMIGDEYEETTRMRCVRLEPKETVKNRNVMFEKMVTEPVGEKSESNLLQQVNPSSQTPSSDNTVKPYHYTAARVVVHAQLSKMPRAPHQLSRLQSDASEPSERKRGGEEGETTGCVQSRKPKRSKKGSVPIEDTLAQNGF